MAALVCSKPSNYSIGGAGNVTIGTASNLGTWSVGASFNNYLYACCASSLIWALVSGTLPPGLTLSPTNQLSGVLTAPGTYTFLISARDSSNSASKGLRQFTLTVSPLVLSSAQALPYGNAGASYNQTLMASGGTGSLTWSLAPSSHLPSGLTLSSSGTISGTPTQTGQFQFTLTATDSAGNTGSWLFTLLISPAPVMRYVSDSGSDSNHGTLSQSWQTISKCATSVFAGSMCFVRAGSYRETVAPNSGITITAYNNE